MRECLCFRKAEMIQNDLKKYHHCLFKVQIIDLFPETVAYFILLQSSFH